MLPIKVDVLNVNEARELGLRCIPEEGVFLEPGDMILMTTDGCPVIFAMANAEMLIAHTHSVDIIDAIVQVFKNQGISPDVIEIAIQTYTEDQESEFVGKALERQLVHVSASTSYPIPGSFLALADAAIGGENFVRIQRS